MTARPRRILMGIRLVEALRDVLQGVIAYMKLHQCNWQLQCVDVEEFEQNLHQPGVDGAITHISPRFGSLAERIQQSSVKTVNILDDLHTQLPSVASDDQALGRSGAEYFILRGFRNFAFLGVDAKWSNNRRLGFGEVLARAQHDTHLSETHFHLADYRLLDTGRLKLRLQRWAVSLPKPVAVMACSDLAARAMLAACDSAKLQVPDEVAILGVDNLVATCELASVPLSSVSQDFPRIGFEAARLLDRLMSRRKQAANPLVLIPPGPIVVRRSTDIFAFEDPNVAAAMRYIHQRASNGFSMKQLMNEIPVSRKWLDVRFKSLIGHTASEEIRRVRLHRVRNLLTSTTLSIEEIADQCAFGSPQNLIRFFREAEGVPPQQFRVLNTRK